MYDRNVFLLAYLAKKDTIKLMLGKKHVYEHLNYLKKLFLTIITQKAIIVL